MITEQLGQRIKELRNATGLSQERFALQIGMDRTYLHLLKLGAEIFLYAISRR